MSELALSSVSCATGSLSCATGSASARLQHPLALQHWQSLWHKGPFAYSRPVAAFFFLFVFVVVVVVVIVIVVILVVILEVFVVDFFPLFVF